MTTPVRDILGQPRGLAWLAGTQFWEAFSLYGMQALLTLYMVGQLLMPGHAENVVGLAATRAAIESITGPLSTQAFAVQLFGLWAGLVRFTPVFGGLLGDRLLGRRRTIMLGCVLMTLGHFCMAFDGSFLAALFLLMLGTGCANSNLFSQVGALYPPEDRRRDDGLQLYYFVLNCGAFIAPIICGWMGAALGWHQAFALAGFGMLAGLLVYTQSGPEGVADFLIVLGASLLATAIFLALAAFLSADAFGRRRTRALALALVVWLACEVFIDLAALGFATFLSSGAASRVVILASLINPIGALRTGALLLVEGTGAFGAASLALLRFTHGPAGAAGLIALSLLCWIALPAWWAGRRLERADI